MHAGTLIHIGTSKRLVVTFTCKTRRSKCAIETISKNITVMVVAGFIIVLLLQFVNCRRRRDVNYVCPAVNAFHQTGEYLAGAYFVKRLDAVGY